MATDGPTIGLLGGTFDPVHVGHLVVAEHLRIAYDLDEVRLVVAGDPWMKSAEASGEARVELARLAVYGAPGLVVDDREVHRPGPTFTADTLAELADEYPDAEFVFAVGSDAAASLHRWERWSEVLDRARVVVVTRPGEHPRPAPEVADRLEHLEVPAVDISSTELRRRYAAGAATRFLVPPSTDRRIREAGLYGAAHG